MTDDRKWPSEPEILISLHETMKDKIEIPTANLGFKKVSTSGYNCNRQPEIAIWPPKPEVIISLDIRTMTDSVELLTANWYF